MANDIGERQRLEASARRTFDAARATVTGSRKIAALYAAALGIVWLSGLEGTLQSAFKQNWSFREINSSQQEAERKIAASYAGLVAEQTEVDRLTKLKLTEESLGKGPTESLEHKIQEAENKLGEAKNARAEARQKVSSKDEADELDEYIAAQKDIQKWQDKSDFLKADREKLKTLDARKAQLAGLKEKSENWKADVRRAYESAKTSSLEQVREVNFELLGVKLKTPILVAPILWSVLLLGLLGYLMLARGRVVALGRQGFRTLDNCPSLTSEEISDIAGILPPWAARDIVPALVPKEKQPAEVELVEDKGWVSQVFGSKQARRASDLLGYLIPAVAVLLQLRVAWIGIELSRHLGSNRTRAMASIALMVATGIACWLAHSWIVSDEVRDRKDAAVDFKNRSSPWLLVGAALVLGAAVVVWLNPSLAISGGLIFQEILWFLWLLPALWMAIAIARKRFLGGAESTRTRGRSITRRNAIVAISTLVLIGSAGLLLRRQRHPRYRHGRHRREKEARRWYGLTTGAGFYANVRHPQLDNERSSRDDKELEFPAKEAVEQDLKSPIVLHYADARGNVWAGGRLPRGPLQRLRIFELVAKSRTEETSPTQDSSSREEHPEAQPDERKSSARIPLTPLISIGVLASGRFEALGPRVHLASASWALEEAALALLRKKPFDRKQSEHVCMLLVFAINHDIYFKAARSRRPSYRLYDLLAGVCVRFNQDAYLEELRRLIKATGQEGLFETRMAKWSDPRSSWRKCWRNRKSPLKWTSSSGGVVF